MEDKAGESTLDNALAHLCARFYRAMIKHVGRELLTRGLEITAEQWHVLILVRHRNGQTQKEWRGDSTRIRPPSPSWWRPLNRAAWSTGSVA